MNNIKFSKVVNSPSSALDKDTMYFVKKGVKVCSFVTNSIGETIPPVWPSYLPEQSPSFAVPSVRLRVHNYNVSFM